MSAARERTAAVRQAQQHRRCFELFVQLVPVQLEAKKTRFVELDDLIAVADEEGPRRESALFGRDERGNGQDCGIWNHAAVHLGPRRDWLEEGGIRSPLR